MSAQTPLARIKARRARACGSQRRGVALVLVLGALVILTVFVTELGERSTSSLSAALADRDSLRAEYHARSAVNLSRLLIATEPLVRKAVEPMFKIATKSSAPQIPVWRFTNLVLAPFNDPAGSGDFQRVAQITPETGKNLGLTNGRFELKIVDEDAKINVNSAVAGDPFSEQRLGAQLLSLIGSPQYTELFEAVDLDGQHSNQPAICGAILDWTDADEKAYPCDPAAETANSNEGPEDNFYQQVGLRYQRKNAPFDSLDELRLIRGVGDGFWANFVDPDTNDPDQRVVTVWGQDKINVNTANAQTLLAIVCAGAPEAALCLDPAQMGTFISAVTLAKSLTQGAPIFKSPKSFVNAMAGKGKGVGPLFAMLGIEPVAFKRPKEVQKSITTESRVFSIYADGVVPGRNRETRIRIHTVVDYRSANELGAPTLDSLMGLPGPPEPSTGATPAPTAPATPTSEPLTPEQIAAALASDPMGVIIYHRVE